MSHLQVLCLNHNRIEQLFSSTEAPGSGRIVLQSLQVLHLAYNGISNLENIHLNSIPSLKALFLQGLWPFGVNQDKWGVLQGNATGRLDRHLTLDQERMSWVDLKSLFDPTMNLMTYKQFLGCVTLCMLAKFMI